MTMKAVSPDDLAAMIGQETGISDWITVGQDRINQFADVTEDHQFIHVDEARAKATPFGGTIAHGFLTLSLLSSMIGQAGVAVEGATSGVNYGFEKVRFLSPVPAGGKVRGRFVLKSAVEKRPGQWLLTYDVSVEIDGQKTPAIIAEWLGLQLID